jgi:hypothetical protein
MPSTPLLNQRPISNQLKLLVWRKPFIEIPYPAIKEHESKNGRERQENSERDNKGRGHLKPQH